MISENSRPLRIAHLVSYLSPAGKEMGIIKLMNGMDEKRFKSSLIVLGKVYHKLGIDTGKTKIISLNKKEGNDYSLPFKLARILKQEKIDIVHTHAWGTLVEGIMAAKLARTAVVVHGEHGTFHKDAKRKAVQKLFFNWADQVLSVSGILADSISNSIGIKRGKITAILNGVDSDRFKPDEQQRKNYRKKHQIDEKTIWIGTVGRPMKVKNQQLMIRAAKILKQKNYKLKWALIGDSPKYSMRPDLEKLSTELQVENEVMFLGNQDDVPGYLNALDIFVLPSLSEGCSNAIQEAMSCGLPVVASRVGGNSELVQDNKNGLLFKSDDANDFTNAIEKLVVDSQLRNEYGKQARADVLAKFSLETMIKNYQSLYLKSYNGPNDSRA